MPQAPRILLIAPQPFYEPRGTPMNVLQMCRVLTEAGSTVDLATFPLGQPVEMAGLEIHRGLAIPGIRHVPIGFSWSKVLCDLSLAGLVLWLFLRRRHVVVHAIEESVFLALPLRWLGAPLIYDLDSLISDQLAYSGAVRSPRVLRWVAALEDYALRSASAAITVCRALTEAVRSRQPELPVFQIEDAPLEESSRDPEPRAVAALRQRLGLEGRKTVVYTGNLESYQGLELLLEAAAILRPRLPEACFVLVGGDASQVERTEGRARELGLEPCFRLVGQRPPAEMPEWLALADALVSPRTEGTNTPFKIYGYMRSGRPIVATEIESHTQVLDTSTAALCAPEATSLAATLEAVLRDPARYGTLAELARERLDHDYGLPAFRRKLLGAYRSIAPAALPPVG